MTTTKIDRDGFVTRNGATAGQVRKNDTGRGNGKWMARPAGDAFWTYADTKAQAIAMCK